MDEVIRVRCAIMRGGTSKAVFLNENVLPKDPIKREWFILALFGSPDKRQIDGLGGADILTSKCAIIGPPSRPDADVDYTFAQVGIDKPMVSFDIICGNISSAVGVYAIEEGFVRAQEPNTVVRVHNTNTGKIFRTTVPVKDGVPRVEGDLEIDGVPGTGAEITMDYSQTVGASTGKLLPTGKVRDILFVPLLNKNIEVSIVDIGTVSVFFRASDIRMIGTEKPEEFTSEKLDIFEQIRTAAAELIGLSAQRTILPFQVMVAPPLNYEVFSSGKVVRADEIDVSARMASKGSVHKAFPGGGSVCTAVAANIEGTLIHEICSHRSGRGNVRIGHPSGVLTISCKVERENDKWEVEEVLFSRTARRIMEGYAYIRKSKLL